MRYARITAAMAVYIGSIVAANVMTDRWGLVSVGFGLVVTAGTFAAGFALVARDFVHRIGGVRLALAGIGAGTVLSAWLASPGLAFASCVAFAGAELLDLYVYAGARSRVAFPAAVLYSNLISAPVDTVLFLALAPNIPLTWNAVAGQLVAKLLYATVIPLVLMVVWADRRVLLRQPV